MASSPAPMPPKSRLPDVMTVESDRTRAMTACSVEVSPGEVDAGADMVVRVAGIPSRDLRGRFLSIEDQDGALVKRIELDDEGSGADGCVLAAPLTPATYTWRAVCPGDSESPARSVPFSFTVKPHETRVAVWGVPPAIERGEPFRVRVGVKCSSECRPEDWAVEVRDHEGQAQATVTLSEAPWPGTTALYHAEVALRAPDEEGLFEWHVSAPLTGTVVPHTECVAGFRVRVEPAPQCLLTVMAIDMDSQTPVQGARVVVHPYRSVTDERGVAALRVPKGQYRVFVSGGNYFPYRGDGELKADTTIRAELTVDRGLSDADLWS